MPTDRPNARAVADDHATLCESASRASAAAPGVAVWRFQLTIRRGLRSRYQPRPRASCPKRLQGGWRWSRLQSPVLNGSALGVHRQPSFPPSREDKTVGCSSTLPFLLIGSCCDRVNNPRRAEECRRGAPLGVYFTPHMEKQYGSRVAM